jgi:hypothetical protein
MTTVQGDSTSASKEKATQGAIKLGVEGPKKARRKPWGLKVRLLRINDL